MADLARLLWSVGLLLASRCSPRFYRGRRTRLDLQVVHVIATSIHDSMGVTTALREIAAAQVDLGLDVGLLANGAWPGDLDPRVRLVECGARDMPGRLAKLAGDRGVVHSHVPWRLPALAPLLLRRRERTFVHSPHGSFAPAAWEVHRARKRLAWALLFGRAIRQHDLMVVNSPAEQAEVEAMGLGLPVVHIPHPITVPEPPQGEHEGRTLAFLGRIHPIKGVLDLVRAWIALGGAAGWTLRIAGPSEDPVYAAQVRAAAAGRNDIEFIPAIFGADRWGFLAEADVVAIPSRSENFCYVVAEALAMGTPVLTTLGVPWPGIGAMGLGWRGEGTVQGLRDMLARAVATEPEVRCAMGARGRTYIQGEFGAGSVARRYLHAYEAVKR